jgi:glycosyltransferase involved in cell wall biosynthesis
MNLTPSASLPPLACNYLLVIHIPVVVDRQGRRWIERLWAVDLARHTDYISRLTVACAFVHGEPGADMVPADEHGFHFVKIAFRQRSLLALFDAPLVAWQLWRLIGRNDIVHSLYGQWWPLDTPYITNLITRLRGKCLMINVEASPWRIMRGERASLLRRWQSRSVEALNRWTISLADIAFFTHEGYLRDLMPNHGGRGHVVHATWIDEAIVQSDAAAEARWQARPRDGTPPLRLLFAGRLQEDKGIHVMLDALRRLRSAGRTRVQLSIIGAGALEGVCREQARLSDDRVQLDVLDPVAYGEPFFALLRGFDAVLVPSLADEQPRIVYDAYSQALPVLASATPGLKTCVADGVNGRLFAPADAQALVDTIAWAADNPAALHGLGMAALTTARAMTHQNMHRRRHALIARLLAERGLA